MDEGEMEKKENPEEVYSELENLGKEFIFQGRIQRNDLSSNLEMSAAR